MTKSSEDVYELDKNQPFAIIHLKETGEMKKLIE